MNRFLAQSPPIALLLVLCLFAPVFAANIDPDGDGHMYAWSENTGWINFAPNQGPGVTVSASAVTGYAWSENTGWIKMAPDACDECGVQNDGRGNLSGYAWGENAGWISFSCADTDSCAAVSYGVVVDPDTGVFSGYAWGASIGWIRFDHARAEAHGVKTAWRDNCPDDPQKDEAGVCGCGTADTDSDDDGVLDCNDAFPTDPAEVGDNDGDGMGDNQDGDDDNDGMPDGWESANGFDPATADSHGDADGDGLSNMSEYQKGSDPNQTTPGPGIPELLSPADLKQEASLAPTLEAGYTATADTGTHGLTHWQAAADATFDALVLDVESEDYLNLLVMPSMVLDEDRDYHWRARYVDNDGVAWMWAQPFSFSTQSATARDDDDNGIPDDQQMPAGEALDLDGDGTPDDGQAGMMVVALPDGNGQISFMAEDNVQSIQGLVRIDPGDVADGANRPDELPLGLFRFRCVLETAGQPALVRAYCTTPFAANTTWYKYDAINGWQDYSSHVTFSADRRSVLIELMDGGSGDADGTANGIVVDPSGPAVVYSGGGCFILSLTP